MNVERARALMRGLEKRGVRVWLGNGEAIRYRAPKGTIGVAEMELLNRHRDAIVGELRRATHRYNGRMGDSENVAPLTFVQLAHWNTYGLDRRRSACIIPLAVRLRGPVCMSALKEGALEVISRHGALRTKVEIENEPTQRVVDTGGANVTVEKVAAGSGSWSAGELHHLLLDAIPPYIDPVRDPLCGVRIFDLGEQDFIVLMYMEHVISDGFSLAVALRDLLTSYRLEVYGSRRSARERPFQYLEYAHAQRAHHEIWLAAHGGYLSNHFAGCGRVRIPRRTPQGSESRSGWGVAEFRFDESLVRLVHTASRSLHTTVVMATFISYVAFVMRWCDVSDMVVLFQSDGRARAGCQESIGYYAFPLYLRIHLDRSDTLADLSAKIIAEYCAALEHADEGWMESSVPRPEFTRNTCFNWLPRAALEPRFFAGSHEQLSVTEVAIDTHNLGRLERDTEPMMGIVGAPDEIAGGVYFPRDRFGDESMERFVTAFLRFSADVLENPSSNVNDVRVQLE